MPHTHSTGLECNTEADSVAGSSCPKSSTERLGRSFLPTAMRLFFPPGGRTTDLFLIFLWLLTCRGLCLPTCSIMRLPTDTAHAFGIVLIDDAEVIKQFPKLGFLKYYSTLRVALSLLPGSSRLISVLVRNLPPSNKSESWWTNLYVSYLKCMEKLTWKSPIEGRTWTQCSTQLLVIYYLVYQSPPTLSPLNPVNLFPLVPSFESSGQSLMNELK